MKRAKNLYLKDDMPKTGSFYSTGYEITNNGKVFELYHRGKMEYFKDIPVGQNDIGIIYKGFFIKMFKAHPNTLDFGRTLGKVAQHIAKKQVNIELSADELINKWNGRNERK